MSMPGTKIFAIISASLAMCGCLRDPPCDDVRLEGVGQADRIVISDNLDREISAIVEADRIASILALVKAHQDEWKTGTAGTPVAMLRANFYRGREFLGDFGIGSDFVTARGCGHRAFRSISAEERSSLMSLVAVPDPYDK